MTTYKTQDYSLANWLVFNGVEFIGAVEYPPDTRKSFVFKHTADVEYLVEQWGPPRSLPTVEPALTCKKFFFAHTEIKKALKESLNANEV